MTSKPRTLADVLEQPLWGNKHVTIYEKSARKTLTLNFKEWAKSNLLYIKDLKCNHGKLDDNYIIRKLSDKRDVFSQLILVMKALRPYRNIISDYTPATNDNEVITAYHVHPYNSKKYYTQLTEQIMTYNVLPLWKFTLGISPDDYKCIFKHKLLNTPDLKIREFNFKTIHGILSCESNMQRWKLQNYTECSLCKATHSILHMLYECPMAKKNLEYTPAGFHVYFNEEYHYLRCERQNRKFYYFINFLLFV